MKIQKKKLGELLVEHKLITQQQLMEALVLQKNTGKKLGEALASQGLLTESDMMNFLQLQLGIRFVDLSKRRIDPKLASSVPLPIAQRYTLVPISLENGKLEVAMEDPLDFVALEDLKRASKHEIIPALSLREPIRNTIRQLYGSDYAEKAVKEYSGRESGLSAIPAVTPDSPLDEASNAPIVRLIDSIIEQAVQMNASDIHIEPGERDVRFRVRVDGVLKTELNIPKDLHSALVARVKIMGGMNIAEKRLPQDGRIEISSLGKQIDLRISVMPTWHGEKVVIRLLDRSSFLISKDKLGFSSDNLIKFSELLKNPHGLILVVGPTGSGKTTTLYSMLNDLNVIKHNIITIEDPVEYLLAGINQTQVNVKAGLTFAIGLRALLRQDPDIVMVGEIRDTETAEIAIRAAITGHLVLSTLHTNDAVATIVRLTDMGVDNYLLAAAITGVISQRLLRKICPNCKTVYNIQSYECEMLGIDFNPDRVFYKGRGCSLCDYSGYKGRLPVFEILVIDKKHRDMISRRTPIEKIKQYSKETGMITLMDECLKLLDSGLTTVEEAIRVSYSKDG
jgi:type IV pilus assembly protein PilB